MKIRDFISIDYQLTLPFLETDEEHLREIFYRLRQKFNFAYKRADTLIDLGAGNGKIVIYSALRYGVKSVGLEISQNLIKEANDKINWLKKNRKYKKRHYKKIKIKNGDLFNQSLEKFNFVYIFSLPTMQKYLKHVFKTAKKDTIFISYKYPLLNFDSFLKLEDTIYHSKKVLTKIYRKK
ncbi:MAG: methyltransferase domain-containing protein [Candidatus Lokiarchaeota archaeon]|nr:methyltransferase domain-containing protein [Candidatus Lokiarchaeota archaeon]MBD3340878.1 methyltransferase domain-containing protein [Candidatus Lokiarchaeota archaeon]